MYKLKKRNRNTCRKTRFPKKGYTKKFPEPCTDDMNFQECELAILRQSVDEVEDTVKRKAANSEEVKNMIQIVERFLREQKCICYGGTAINNILPTEVQFYDKGIEIPDYDFYSKTPVDHAKMLSDIFHKEGYADVEAKAGVHHGTYKVYVNFIPMADITYMHTDLFDNLGNEAMNINGILYAPPNFLRMGMYLELSRPEGDVSRWEKVMKRLTLLNKYHPLTVTDCFKIDFQRKIDTISDDDSSKLYLLIRDSFIEQGGIFFGGYAGSLYSRYMPSSEKRIVKSVPDFDVLCENIELSASIVSQKLKTEGYNNIELKKHESIGEVVPMHYEIIVNNETVAFIYEPIACHNYNEVHVEGKPIRVATIDTILSFYLAFIYSNHAYDDRKYKDRLMCMSKFLFDVEQKNRLSQMGLLKRFSLPCYGKQATLESIRTDKTNMFRKLRDKRGTDVWDEWFLKYNPAETKTKTKTNERKPKESKLNSSTKTKTKKKRKNKLSEYLF